MEKIRSYEKESSDDSYLLASVTWVVLATVFIISLIGVFSL